MTKSEFNDFSLLQMENEMLRDKVEKLNNELVQVKWELDKCKLAKEGLYKLNRIHENR